MSEYNIYEHRVTLFSLLPKNWNLNIGKYPRLRLLFRYFYGGYRLFCCESGNRIIGFCFLKKNYFKLYSDFANKKDWIITPDYFVLNEYRNQGIATELIRRSVKINRSGKIYALVRTDNDISMKVLSKCGFYKKEYYKNVNHRFVVTSDKDNFILMIHD